jgi:hypothetical protein
MPQTQHVALLGDSIFDNAAYTAGAPDVATHLRGLVAPHWEVSLLARDGARIAGLDAQLLQVADTVSHLIISVGGNDALQNIDLLSLRVNSGAEILNAFAERASAFERAYHSAIMRTRALGRSTTLCTVYNGALDASEAAAARMGLAIFNDAILRTAVDLGVDAIELRSVCTEPADYANPIEPSGQGGLKIATAIAGVLGAVEGSRSPRIWGRPRS